MVISPITAIEQKWITHPDFQSIEDWEKSKYINPNAIDFTLDTLFTVDNEKIALISEETRIFRSCELQYPQDDIYTLYPGGFYDGMSKFTVNIPEGVCALLINRSTLNRAGVHLNAGLYDAGYNGNIGFSLYNRIGATQIKQHTRVGQIMFLQSDSVGLYNGIYNNIQGHWSNKVN